MVPRSSHPGARLSVGQRHARCGVARGAGLLLWRVRLNPGHDIARVHGSGLLRDPSTVREQHERGNAANAELSHKLLFLIRVDLKQTETRLEFGGGALIRGLDVLLSQETGLPIHVDEDPLTCVVRGTGRILDDEAKYWSVLAT